jgi:hypothetical protein
MAAALFMHIFTMSSSEWNTLKVQLFNKKQTLEIYVCLIQFTVPENVHTGDT